MSRVFNYGDNHIFVCGLTRSGKSRFTRSLLVKSKYPVLYFNIQGEKVENGFMRIDAGNITSKQLIELLDEHKAKINLCFSDMRNAYRYTAGHLLDVLMMSGFSDKNPIYVVIDECHLLKGLSLEMAKVCATAGLKKGVRLVFITQRPANADKTLYTQSYEQYIFETGEAERGYFKDKGVDFDRCRELWAKNGKYSYCYFNGYALEGYKSI